MTDRHWLWLARCLVRLGAPLVPAARRSDWRREWEAELFRWWSILSPEFRGSWVYRARLLRRAALALEDAALFRSHLRAASFGRTQITRTRREPMQELLQNLRFAFRMIRRNPGFAAVVVITLGLGIGANTAVFSVINTVLLRPLPYDEPDRMTLVWTNFGPDLPQNWISGPEFVEMREFNNTFEDIAVAVPSTVAFTGDGEPVQVPTGLVSGNMFDVLRVLPHIGRLIGLDDDLPGAAPVAVLSHEFWTGRYGGDPSVLGSSVILDGQAFEVVGIIPAGFKILHPEFPERIDIWTSLLPQFGSFFGGQPTYAQLSRGSHGMRGFARLKAGVSIEQAQADMDAVALAMQERNPNYYSFTGWGLTVYSMREDLVEEARPALLVLFGAVGFVLLIACVNVANLMLARAAVREREIAVRIALGAGRTRIAKQLMTESVTLGLAGGILGLATAFGALRALVVLAPDDLPRRAEIGVDPMVLLFTLGVSLVTSLLFGLAPAFHGMKTNLAESFKEGGRGATSGLHGRNLRGALVVAEVALALVLLVGAGLMIRSFQRLLETDAGYTVDDLITMRVPLSFARYQPPEAVTFWNRLLRETAGLPGVQAVGSISHLPLSNSYSSGTTVVEASETLLPNQRAWEVDRRFVSAGYFETMQSPLVAGRLFTEADRAGVSLVAVVDEEFVRRAWPSEDPIGQRVGFDQDADGNMRWREVVGVIRHQKHYDLNTTGREQAYFPFSQGRVTSMFLAARVAGDPMALAASIRRLVWDIDPEQTVADIATMDSRVREAVAQPRFNLILLTAFAAVALILATVGIYGVISYSVAQRGHEIGVRMALGAKSQDVVAMVLKQGVGLVAVGLGVGTAAAFALTRVMQTLLFEVSASDPVTYVVVGVILLGVGTAASLLPARRAARLEALSVLTTE